MLKKLQDEVYREASPLSTLCDDEWTHSPSRSLLNFVGYAAQYPVCQRSLNLIRKIAVHRVTMVTKTPRVLSRKGMFDSSGMTQPDDCFSQNIHWR